MARPILRRSSTELLAVLASVLLVMLFVAGIVHGQSESATSSTTTSTTTPTPASNSTSNPTVKLGVFMESLCPDTRRFFRNQLVPTQRLVGQLFELTLVPFGHARVLGNNKMVCQHGAKECEGNRRMACILARSNNQTEIVETFNCLLQLDSSPQDCLASNMAGVSFDDIEKCTTGDESYGLMISAEKTSGRLGYVPHLKVDGKSSNEIQDQAENHLKDYICELYTGSARPEACKDAAP